MECGKFGRMFVVSREICLLWKSCVFSNVNVLSITVNHHEFLINKSCSPISRVMVMPNTYKKGEKDRATTPQ